MSHIQLINLVERKSPDGTIQKFCYAFPIIIRELMKTEHTFDLVDLHLHRLDYEQLAAKVLQSDAKVFGISAWSLNYSDVKDLTARIRHKDRDAIIIVGGIISGNDQVLLEKTETDIVVTGAEGELIMPEVLDCLDSDYDLLHNVKGISFKDRSTGEMVKTECRPLMNLEQFQRMEMPAYEYFDEYLHELADNINARENVPVKAFPHLAGRGCPFKCTFCGHLYGHKFLRKNWDLFFDELDYLQERYGAQGFYSLDTNLFLNRQDVDDYCDTYTNRNCSFGMIAELRLSFGDYEMYKKLADHGVKVVVLGFESGSQDMLDRMRKGIKLPKAKQVIKDCLDADVCICGGLLFGTPGENKQTMKENRDYLIFIEKAIEEQKRKMAARGKTSTSFVEWSLLVPSPTSELYKIAMEDGLITDVEDYLLQVSQDRFKQPWKSATFRIRLNKEGYLVNMSEFSSTAAMGAYALYIDSVVKMRVSFYRHASLKEKVKQFATSAFGAGLHYSRYLGAVALDTIAGRKGYIPRDKREPV